jgi:predicted histone-like DNA-binding protein
MSIQIKTIAKKNPRDPAAAAKLYAHAVPRGKTDIDVMSKIISREGTVSRADVYAVIISTLEVIMNELEAGRAVYLGKLGSFSISLSSEGADTADDFTSAAVKKARIVFRPGSELKTMLKTLKYEKVS